MKVEPAFLFLTEVGVVRAAGEMGGMAIAVIADRLRGGGEDRRQEDESGGADH
jgi:hypothetical protein